MLDRPIKFAPRLKTVIWGGDKIAQYKGIDTDLDHIGESWELSVVHGAESIVEGDDQLNGLTLNQLVERYGEDLLGKDVARRCTNGFPLLIKIIDARSNLSVQVHPNDDLARERHNSHGKTEMWYIISADKGAKIYTGLSASLTPDEYERRVADNTIMDVVAAHDSAAGQFYFVPAGTLHAIGAGNLLAEVQQSSDITYRVYDYDRRDANGNPRELHTQQAKEAIDYRYPNILTPTAQAFDRTTKGAVKCEHFTVDYLDIKHGESEKVDTHRRTFAVLICTDGEMTITYAIKSDTVIYKCRTGETLLLPASLPTYEISGTGKALFVTC